MCFLAINHKKNQKNNNDKNVYILCKKIPEKYHICFTLISIVHVKYYKGCYFQIKKCLIKKYYY